MRPATLVMISWSSSSGSEGSRKVFIRVSTHFLSCNPRQAPSCERAQCAMWTLYFIHGGLVAATHLPAEKRLLQAVAIHDVEQVLQHAVKHLVQFLPDDWQRLLRRQYGCVEFNLKKKTNKENMCISQQSKSNQLTSQTLQQQQKKKKSLK